MKEKVLITGSSKGLGKELALKFAQNKYDVIIHGRDIQALEVTKKEIMQKGGDCKIVIGDLKSKETLDKLAEIAKKEDISILINNAGLGEKSALEKTEDSYIEDVLITNLVSLIKLTKRIYTYFLEKGNGTIININSISGLENKEMGSIYGASKWGLRGFSDNLRLESQKNNIRVLSIYPSRIKTRPNFTWGMEKEDAAEKIYNAFQNKELKELIIDSRPLEFRSK